MSHLYWHRGLSHRHELILLREFANVLYQEHQSRLPYYVVGLAFFKLEQMFRDQAIERVSYYPFRAHLLMLFRELAAGTCPSIDREKDIDQHCEKILNVLNNPQKELSTFASAVQVFGECRKKWTTEMGKSFYGMKDIADFTKLLLSSVGATRTGEGNPPYADWFRGRVAKVIIDRYGEYCGFIKRQPTDIFFHAKMNRNLDFGSLQGKSVSYRVGNNPVNNSGFAIDIKLEEGGSGGY